MSLGSGIPAPLPAPSPAQGSRITAEAASGLSLADSMWPADRGAAERGPQFGLADDAIHRGPDFMAHVGRKRALGPVAASARSLASTSSAVRAATCRSRRSRCCWSSASRASISDNMLGTSAMARIARIVRPERVNRARNSPNCARRVKRRAAFRPSLGWEESSE
jgi:hypothetical protein